MRALQSAAISQVELFLNSVPILAPLSRDDKMRLVDALEEKSIKPGDRVITEGEAGDKFYIIKDGEAVVRARGRVYLLRGRVIHCRLGCASLSADIRIELACHHGYF